MRESNQIYFIYPLITCEFVNILSRSIPFNPKTYTYVPLTSTFRKRITNIIFNIALTNMKCLGIYE